MRRASRAENGWMLTNSASLNLRAPRRRERELRFSFLWQELLKKFLKSLIASAGHGSRDLSGWERAGWHHPCISGLMSSVRVPLEDLDENHNCPLAAGDDLKHEYVIWRQYPAPDWRLCLLWAFLENTRDTHWIGTQTHTLTDWCWLDYSVETVWHSEVQVQLIPQQL